MKVKPHCIAPIIIVYCRLLHSSLSPICISQVLMRCKASHCKLSAWLCDTKSEKWLHIRVSAGLMKQAFLSVITKVGQVSPRAKTVYDTRRWESGSSHLINNIKKLLSCRTVASAASDNNQPLQKKHLFSSIQFCREFSNFIL